jgi:hypothetical protein
MIKTTHSLKALAALALVTSGAAYAQVSTSVKDNTQVTKIDARVKDQTTDTNTKVRVMDNPAQTTVKVQEPGTGKLQVKVKDAPK